MKILRPYQQSALCDLLETMRSSSEPALVNASVGAGKSLIIAELLLHIERKGYHALCLTLNSELIRQNVKTYQEQRGNASIFCAALDSKDLSCPIVFASPHSIHSALKTNEALKAIRFNVIVIDEAHNLNINDKNSMYMRLIRYYAHLAQQEQYVFRVVGLTGTPYRGKGISIVGPDCFFKNSVGNITTSWLISQGFLVEPKWGRPQAESYDFDELQVMANGQFNKKQLGELVDKQIRLTGKIMHEVSEIMKSRTGAFIFASTRRHCLECLASLPLELTAVITGETPFSEREEIISKARRNELKFLINVNILTVGVDIPNFDTVVFVRPTESLILYTQAIGRGLRLNSDKQNCLILDYASNIDRHGDIDDPIINKALQDLSADNEDYCIPCYTCKTLNKVTARRCIGTIESKRCDHYFEFKECHKCQTQNDKVARFCRQCETELIDPNAKLSLKKANEVRLEVKRSSYWVSQSPSAYPIIHEKYDCDYLGREIVIGQSNFTHTEKNKNITYARFIRMHIVEASKYYPGIRSYLQMKQMIHQGKIKSPVQLVCRYDGESLKISRKIFSEY